MACKFDPREVPDGYENLKAGVEAAGAVIGNRP